MIYVAQCILQWIINECGFKIIKNSYRKASLHILMEICTHRIINILCGTCIWVKVLTKASYFTSYSERNFQKYEITIKYSMTYITKQESKKPPYYAYHPQSTKEQYYFRHWGSEPCNFSIVTMYIVLRYILHRLNLYKWGLLRSPNYILSSSPTLSHIHQRL